MIDGHVVVLTGGVGGAKLALGLSQVVTSDNLTFIVNTGDDFTHLGLRICPDIDTLCYTLAGLADTDKGWGRAEDTWNFMSALSSVSDKSWFLLGDKDLAVHVERTYRLSKNQKLSAIVASMSASLGIKSVVVPMSDDPVSTMISSDGRSIPFQDYFVRQQCKPRLEAIHFVGADTAQPSPKALAALKRPDLSAVIIAPSNPWLSIDPILSLPSLHSAIKETLVPVIAVTPLPGGRAVKGPTAKIMQELSIPRTVHSIACHYDGLIDGMVVDELDDTPEGISAIRCDTIMTTLDDRMRVAKAALKLASELQQPNI